MKKVSLFLLSLFMVLNFSFDIVYAQVQSDEADKLAQIKEIRQSIKHHQKANEKLENQIMRKSKQLEKILTKLPEDSLVSQQILH